MKKIPYGIINYQDLILENYLYIDKTMYLEKLENAGKTLFYLRPGRFGKSLFTSMMYYYYDINSKDLFDKLFNGLFVHKHPTKEKNNYYILSFDFSGINENKQEEGLMNSFKKCVIAGINKFLNNYNFNYEINIDEPADDMIKMFLSYIQGLKLENKLYIIVDEYDNFTNAILEGSADKFIKIVTGTIKSFYANIKIYVKEGVIGRFFATGICPITLDSMTTGFNIATNISNYEEFNSMIGLTHEEVNNLLNEVVEEKNKREEIKQIMIKNYDGYLFNEDAKEKVFNATLVMYLLNFYQLYKSIPKDIMDSNIAFNSGKIDNLIELKNNSFYKELLNEIMENEHVDGILKIKFDLTRDLESDDIISLLYYFGYLTIEPDIYGGYYFKIPNEVMKVLYGNYFTKKLKESGIGYDNKIISEISKELVTGNIDKLNNYVSEVLKKLDNRDFIKIDEKGIKIIYFTMLLNNEYYNVYSEYVSNNGYIDIYLEKKNPNIPNNIMIELKYIKKKDYSEEILKEKIEEGKSQLVSYSKDKRLGNPLKYLVIFVGNELKLLKSIDY